MKKIALGSDHAAYEFKKEIEQYLIEKGYDVHDYGTYSTERADYPDYGFAVGEAVVKGECELGLLFCGTGIGISIAANKVRGVRCANCSEPYSAQMARRHNNANCLAIGARTVGIELAKMVVDAFLTTDFESGGRHEMRVSKIDSYDNQRG